MADGPRGWGQPFDDVVPAYLADLELRARPSTVQAARVALERLQREMPNVTVRSARAWREARVKAGATNKTANTDLCYLHAAVRMAVNDGVLAHDPLAGLKRLPVGPKHQNRRPRALEPWELSRLLDEARLADARRRSKFPQFPLLFALACTGARWGELTSIVWADVRFDVLEILFRAENTKGETERSVPLREDLAEVLLGLREPTERATGSPPSPGSRVFLTPKGCEHSKNTANFRAWFRELLDAASIPPTDARGRVVCIHGLRHTFTTRVLRAGNSVATTQLLTGHKSPSSLLGTYAQLVSEDARNAANGLTPLGGIASVRLSDRVAPTPRASIAGP